MAAIWPGHTPHSLRHSFGTALNAADNDVKTIQATMGHRSPRVTLETYVHPVDSKKREAVDKLSQLLG